MYGVCAFMYVIMQAAEKEDPKIKLTLYTVRLQRGNLGGINNRYMFNGELNLRYSHIPLS